MIVQLGAVGRPSLRDRVQSGCDTLAGLELVCSFLPGGSVGLAELGQVRLAKYDEPRIMWWTRIRRRRVRMECRR